MSALSFESWYVPRKENAEAEVYGLEGAWAAEVVWGSGAFKWEGEGLLRFSGDWVEVSRLGEKG